MPETETPQTENLSLPLLPLNTGVVLPQMVVTLALETAEARDAADGGDRRPTGGCCSCPASAAGSPGSARSPGSRASASCRTASAALVLRGLARARVGAPTVSERAGVWVEAEPVAERADVPGRVTEMAREYQAVVRGIAEKLGSPRIADALAGVDDPGALADTAGWSPDLSVERKVELLETLDPEARIEKALAWAREALAELEVARADPQPGHRGHGEDAARVPAAPAARRDPQGAGRGRVTTATWSPSTAAASKRPRLPDDVRDAIEREIDRLERTSEQSPEHGWIRTWLDTVLEVPWGKRSDERLDVAEARAILDADHTGLDDVKDRIVEYLAVRKLRAERGIADRESEPEHATSKRRSARVRSSRSSGRPASARRRSASRSHARSAASSCASRSAACTTRPRSAVTGARTSARGPGASCARSPRRAR